MILDFLTKTRWVELGFGFPTFYYSVTTLIFFAIIFVGSLLLAAIILRKISRIDKEWKNWWLGVFFLAIVWVVISTMMSLSVLWIVVPLGALGTIPGGIWMIVSIIKRKDLKWAFLLPVSFLFAWPLDSFLGWIFVEVIPQLLANA